MRLLAILAFGVLALCGCRTTNHQYKTSGDGNAGAIDGNPASTFPGGVQQTRKAFNTFRM